MDKFETAIARFQEFCKKLKDELDSAKTPTPDRAPIQPVYLFQDRDLGTILLDSPSYDEFRDCLLELYEAVPHGADTISLRAVESAVHEAILKTLSPNAQNVELAFAEKLTAAFVEMREKLQRAPTLLWIHLEVAGLVTEELPRTVGSIEFYARTDAASHPPPPGSSRVPAAYARVPVKAVDPNAAIEAGIRELRQTLDVLNYFGGVVGNSGARVYLPWEAKAFPLKVGISDAQGTDPSLMHREWRGPWIPFYLNLLFGTPRAERGGFPRAVEILSRTRSKLEERLLSAIQWAGRATVEERREEAFVLFTVALESLLVNRNEKDQITQRFAIRGAHLIGRDFASRKILYKRLKELYGLRSAIVHSGSTQIADADRDTIAYFVRVAIYTMLVLEPFCDMRTVEQFHSWFEDKILGSDESTFK